jgi:Na+/melibiose symporter-like transporter
MQYGNLMSPIMSLFISLFSPLSGTLENFFGPHITLLIGAIVSEICLFLFYLQRNIWIFYSITLFSGLGVGISGSILLKNACFYYPQKKGLISASIQSFLGLGMAFYILLAERLINPEKKGLIDEETDPYYSEEVSKNIKKYFIFAMIALPLQVLLSFFMFFKYNPNCEIDENENDEQISDKNKEENEDKEDNVELKDTLINIKK